MIQRHFLWILLALNVVAAAFFARHWVDRRGQLKNHGWVVPVAVYPELPAVDTKLPGGLPPDTLRFAALQDRPLFSATRRPPPPPPPPKIDKPAPVDPLANVHVFGLFAGDGGEGGALLRVDGKIRSIVRGGKIGPWTVAAVTATELKLESAGGSRVLTVKTVPGQRALVAGTGPSSVGAPVSSQAPAPRARAIANDRPLSPAAQARAEQIETWRRNAEERAARRAAARAAREAEANVPASGAPPAN